MPFPPIIRLIVLGMFTWLMLAPAIARAELDADLLAGLSARTLGPAAITGRMP